MTKRIALFAVVLLTSAMLYADTARGSFDRTLNVSGPVQLAVENGSGQIRVHRGTPGKVAIHADIFVQSGNALDKVRRIEQAPPIEQSGNSIRVGRISDSDLRRNVSISYDITVPGDTTLEARTGSGGISVEDVAGGVRATTGSGGIQGRNLGRNSGGHIQVQTGSGSIELDQIHSSLYAQTGSGTIRASGNPGSGWELRTGSGGIHVQVPANAAFDVLAKTGSGGLRIEQPLTLQGTISRHSLEGKVGGGGRLLRAQTGSGSIRIGIGGSSAL